MDADKRAVVISDVHLGSSHCRVELLEAFLRLLPADCRLVLNGDTLDAPQRPLPARHEESLEALREVSRRNQVIWVRGNHDDGYDPGGNFVFVPSYHLGHELLILHGDHFDNVMPKYRWFLRLFETLHKARMRLGAKPVHVARFAKKLKPLYSFLCRHVRLNAVQYASEQKYSAITCGHVHYVEDTQINGCRYLNTGCWTEEATACILLDETGMQLVAVEACVAAGRLPFRDDQIEEPLT